MEIIDINKKDDTDNTYIFFNIILGVIAFAFCCFVISMLTKSMKTDGLQSMGDLSGCILGIAFFSFIGMSPILLMMQARNEEIDEINEKNKNYYEYIIEYNINNTVENITTEEIIKLIMGKETFDEKYGETKTLTIKVPNDNRYNDFVCHINEMERQRRLEKEKQTNKIYTKETHNL